MECNESAKPESGNGNGMVGQSNGSLSVDSGPSSRQSEKSGEHSANYFAAFSSSAFVTHC